MSRLGPRVVAAVVIAGAVAHAQQGAGEGALPIDVGGTPLSIAALDIDGDSDLDLAVAVEGARYRVALLRNGGGGAFVLDTSLPDVEGVSRAPLRDLVAADVDQDGDL